MAFDGRARYAVLTAFCLLYFLLMSCTFNSLGMVLPYMVKDLGWNWAQAGVGFTLLGLACGLSGMAPAMMIRRIGVSRTMLAGGVALVAGFCCFGLTHSTTVYYLGAILAGLGFSLCGTVPGVHVISHSFERRSTAVGIYFMAGGLGAVVGPLLVYGTQALTDDWRLYWFGAAVASIVFSVFAAIVTAARNATPASAEDAAKTAAEPHSWTVRDAIRKPQFYVVVAAYSAFLLINTTVHSFAAQHVAETGFGLGIAAALLSAAALVSAIGSAAAGVAGERVGPRQLAILSLGVLVAGTVALAISGSWAAMAVFVVGLGTGMGFCYVCTAMLLLDFFGRRANLELYSIMCVISTVAAIGPALGGVVRDATGSFEMVFMACAALGFVMLLALIALRRPVPAGAAEPAAEDAALVPQYG